MLRRARPGSEGTGDSEPLLWGKIHQQTLSEAQSLAALAAAVSRPEGPAAVKDEGVRGPKGKAAGPAAARTPPSSAALARTAHAASSHPLLCVTRPARLR